MTRISLIKQWLKEESASTSVEFSMVGLGFIVMLVGVIEVGRLAWTSNVVDYAVDESARYAVLHQDATSNDVESYARNLLNSYYVPSTNLDITVSDTNSSGVDFIEIEGSYNFVSMTSGILPAAISEFSLNVTSRRPVYIYDEVSN